jgi:hypothetical protein
LTKNLTLSLPDELGEALAKFPEVNWSAVARDSIESYVKLREKPDLAEVVQLLIDQRGTEYTRGVQMAQTLAKTNGNKWVDVIVREYRSTWWEEAEKAFKDDTDGNYNRLEDVSFTDEFEGNLMYQAWKKHDSTAWEESDSFKVGFMKTILEIHEMVRKGAK